jgi:DNA-3-methyladenine glycosylase
MSRDAAPRARRSRLGSPLPFAFYDRPTEVVSRELLGRRARVHDGRRVTRGVIVETEAYLGPDDPACHAVAGLTARTTSLRTAGDGVRLSHLRHVLVLQRRHAERGHGSAVLVRAVSPTDGLELMRPPPPKVKRDRDLTNGPGKLCLAMGIVGSMSGPHCAAGRSCIRQRSAVADADVVVTPRIGITQACRVAAPLSRARRPVRLAHARVVRAHPYTP